MNMGTARTCARFGGPPRTSRAAITTRLPVTWAVKMPRLKNPITSTMPATTASRGASHPGNRATSCTSFAGCDPGRTELGTVDIGSPLCSRLRSHSAAAEAINDDLRNNDAEAHRENDSDGSHPVGNRRTQELQRGIRANRKLQEATRHSEQEDARHHRDHRGKAYGREWHMRTTSDWSENHADYQTGYERAGRSASAKGKCPPPQSMSQHADGDRPFQHAQGRRKENAVGGNGGAG